MKSDSQSGVAGKCGEVELADYCLEDGFFAEILGADTIGHRFRVRKN